MLGNKAVPPAFRTGSVGLTAAAAHNGLVRYQGKGMAIKGDIVYIVSDGTNVPNWAGFSDRNIILACDWTNDFEIVGYLRKLDTSVTNQIATWCHDPDNDLIFFGFFGGSNYIISIDVSDPTDMFQVGTLSSAGWGTGVAPGFGSGYLSAKNGVLMVATPNFSGGNQVKKVTYNLAGTTLTLVGGVTNTSLQGVNAIIYDGTYAYSTNSTNNRVAVIDCTTANPTVTGFVTHANFLSLHFLSILDATHLVVHHTSGMSVIDHTIKASPTRVGGIQDAGIFGPQGASICFDGYANVIGFDHKPFSVNCNTPSAPVIDTYYTGDEYAYSDSCVPFGDATNKRFAFTNLGTPDDGAVFSTDGSGGLDLVAFTIDDLIFSADFVEIGDNIMMAITINGYSPVYDVSDPDNPILIYRLDNGAEPPSGPEGRAGLKVGNRVYITDNSSDSLWIIDITTPEVPSIITEWIPGGEFISPYGLAKLTGDYIFCTSSDQYVYIINISNPDSPILTKAYDATAIDTSLYRGIATYGNFGMFIGFEDRIGILDCTNHATPSSLTVFVDPEWSTDDNALGNLAVHDHYLFATTYNGLFIYDLDPDPTDPIYVKKIPFWNGLDNSYRPAISGDRLWSWYYYPPDWSVGVIAQFDLTNIENAHVVAYSTDYPNGGGQLFVINENLILIDATGEADSRYFRINPIGSYNAIGMANETSTAQAITHKKTKTIGQVIETDTAQVLSINPQRRLITQITTVNTARTIERGFDQIPMDVVSGVTASDVPQLEGARGIDTQGDYAYIATQASLGGTSDRLTIMNISDPFNMTYVGSIGSSSLNNTQDVKVSGNYAYVACSTGDRLTVVDVTTPSAPTIAGSVTNVLLDGAYAVAILDTTHVVVAASDADALVVIDVSVPATPTIAGSVVDVQLDGANAVDVHGNYAFVTSPNQDRLTIVNCTTPSSPTIVGSITDGTNLDNLQGVVLSTDYAYITAGTNRLTVVDITNVASPTVVGSVSNALLNTPVGLDILYPYVYIAANGGNDLVAINISNPVSPTVVDNTASPATPTLNEIWDVAISNGYAFVTTNSTSATPSSTGIIAIGPPLPPAFKTAGATNTASTTDRITLALPIGWAPGDYAVACVAVLDNVSASDYAATGWTVAAGTGGASSVRNNILVRALQTGDTNPTFIYGGGGGSNFHVGVILTYSDVTTTHGGWEFIKTTGSTTDAIPSSQSTTVNESIMLSFGCTDFYQPLSLLGGSEQGFTVRATINTVSQGGFVVCDKIITSAGSVTFPTYTGPAFAGQFFLHKAVELASS